MVLKMQNLVIKEESHGHVLLCNSLLKHASTAMNTYTVVPGGVFHWSVIRQNKAVYHGQQ
jgi:hypothetical protein